MTCSPSARSFVLGQSPEPLLGQIFDARRETNAQQMGDAKDQILFGGIGLGDRASGIEARKGAEKIGPALSLQQKIARMATLDHLTQAILQRARRYCTV